MEDGAILPERQLEVGGQLAPHEPLRGILDALRDDTVAHVDGVEPAKRINLRLEGGLVFFRGKLYVTMIAATRR